MSRKRKSLESELPELESYAAKRIRMNPASERKPSANKYTESKKKASNKKEKILSSLMDVEEPDVQDEFLLFTAMDVDDNTTTIEKDNQFDPTVKRLFTSDSDILVPSLVETTTPERSWEANMAHVGSLPNTSSTHKTKPLKSSDSMSGNISSRTTRSVDLSQKKGVSTHIDGVNLCSMTSQYTSPSQQPNTLQKRALVQETKRQPELKVSVPVMNRDIPTMDVVPVVVLESKSNSMWFTWLSVFFVLYFLGSSFWSINMGDPGKTVSIQTTSNTPFTGNSNHVRANQIDEPNLWMKNYSIPRISFTKKLDNISSTTESTIVVEEKENNVVSLEEMESFVFIETASEKLVTEVDMPVSFHNSIDTSSFTFVPTNLTSNLFLQEAEEIVLVSKEEKVEKVNEIQVKEMGQLLSGDEFFIAELSIDDNHDDIEPKDSISNNFILSKQSSFVPSTDIPTIFPATSNLALDTAGVRIVAKESTKKCFKAKQWNPFLCHRPLRTIYSHNPVISATDCFAFYLERNDSQKIYKNTMTLKLFQPAKMIYGFGLTHFVADNNNDSSIFNVSCAPKDVSFTVFENIPTNSWLLSSVSEVQHPIKDHETTTEGHDHVTFNNEILPEGIAKDHLQEEEKSTFEKAKTTSSRKKSFPFPWFKKEKELSFVDSFQIPTTFDGFVFDPLGQDTTRGDYATDTPNSGISVTQFFPLKTAHFPQYVDKVRVQVHSTHGGSDLACVYRVQVYGDV